MILTHLTISQTVTLSYSPSIPMAPKGHSQFNVGLGADTSIYAAGGMSSTIVISSIIFNALNILRCAVV